jgi:competence protein ComEC
MGMLAILAVHSQKASSIGYNLLSQQNLTSEVKYLASVSDIAIERKNFFKCRLKLSQLFQTSEFIPINEEVIAYFKKPVSISDLKPGQLLLLKSKMNKVETKKNPEEFDYAAYLAQNQIFYNTFINSQSFIVMDANKSNVNWLYDIGLKIKFKIIESFRHAGLNKNAFAICSALLTGYDDEIDKSVMDAFAHSGTLHVLSVSGLHTGLIYLLLNFLINIFDPYSKYRIARYIIITFLLWSFALISGFSPPVLRAVIMFSLLGLGKLFYRNKSTNQLNILFASAFILLLYNPYFILNIGFLLSYTAMIGIIVISPLLNDRITLKNKILLYFFESVMVSVAATISTLPLTLYYFKQFPIWFFACNLIIVPLSFLILILAFFSLVHLPFLNQVINGLVNFMIDFIKIFNQGKYTYIDLINFNLLDAIFLSSLILVLYLVFQQRKYHFVVFSLLILISWQFVAFFNALESKQSKFITIYNVKHKSRVVLKNKSEARYNRFDSTSFNYNIKPHLVTFCNANWTVNSFNFIQTKAHNFLILDSADFVPSIEKEHINTLLLANNYALSEPQIQQFKNVKLIIADASNKAFINEQTENLCRKFAIPFYSTRLKGAFTLALE